MESKLEEGVGASYYFGLRPGLACAWTVIACLSDSPMEPSYFHMHASTDSPTLRNQIPRSTSKCGPPFSNRTPAHSWPASRPSCL